jgi:hypothetical protein
MRVETRRRPLTARQLWVLKRGLRGWRMLRGAKSSPPQNSMMMMHRLFAVTAQFGVALHLAGREYRHRR